MTAPAIEIAWTSPSTITPALDALYELECRITEQRLASPAPRADALFTVPSGSLREADYMLSEFLHFHTSSIAFAIGENEGHGAALAQRLQRALQLCASSTTDDIKARLRALRAELMMVAAAAAAV
jgi:hypothetical protein